MKTQLEINSLIFDLDGTLADTMPGLAAALRYVMDELECEKLGCQKPSDDFVRRNIGSGARNLLQKAFGDSADQLMPTALPMFTDYYAKNAVAGVTLYPGVATTLDRLANKHPMALVTAKIKIATLFILEHFDISKYFSVVITADDVKNRKPDPEGVNKILKELNDHPSRSMLIGDTQIDVLTAKNAGVVSCAVTYGYGREQLLQEALYDHVIDTCAELLDLVPSD